MPEHDNHEPLIRELEPTTDESVPKDINKMLETGQALLASIVAIEQRTGRSSLTSKAKQQVLMAMKLIAMHHAVGSMEA